MKLSKAKVFLITGSTGKIGRILVHYFLERGQTVVAVSRKSTNLNGLTADCSGMPGRLEKLIADLGNRNQADTVRELAERQLLPNHLINGARDLANLKLGPNGMPSRAQWNAELMVGIIVPLELTIAIANCAGSPLESVVNIGSMYGVVAANPGLYDNPRMDSPIHYGVIKAGLLQLTKEMAVRLAGRGIRVNAVSFGGLEGRASDEFRARYAKLCPMGRMLRKDEIAEAVGFLTSDGARGMIGHNLVVDGGWCVW